MGTSVLNSNFHFLMVMFVMIQDANTFKICVLVSKKICIDHGERHIKVQT